MNNSNIIVYILFILNIAVFGFYLLSIGQGDPWRKLGRGGTMATMIISGFGVVLLSYMFLTNQFGIKYVYENCALSMKPIYKLTAVWAGQDGTFLLWLFFLNIISVIMSRTMGKYEDWSLLYMKALEMTLSALLIIRSPFAPTPAGVDISDGFGMNALLMNPWMVAHPPMMFIGYAAAAAPFAIFLAATSMGDFSKWVSVARGWIIASWAMLGVGIYLGMYWSYEVLGWGGYWAWDPVENASIFPWIILCGAAHGALLQGYRRSYVIWNAVMVTIAYATVIFGTFLTRSGVLSDFSVHSFPDLELYYPLLFALLFNTLIGVGMLIRVIFSLPKDNEGQTDKNQIRATILSWSIYFFILFFIFVFIGTCLPLITKILGLKQQAPPDIAYYNKTSLLPGVPLSLILLITPIAFAMKKGNPFPSPALIAGGAAGALSLMFLMGLGVTNVPALIILFASSAAIVTNGAACAMHIASGQKSYASYMSHVGVGLILAGIVFSSLGSVKERFILVEGQTEEKLGMKVRLDKLNFQEQTVDADMELIEASRERPVKLRFVGDEYKKKVPSKPWIFRGLVRDVYFSPQQVAQTGEQGNTVNMKMGEKTSLCNQNDAFVTFKDYDLKKVSDGIVGAVVVVEFNGKEQEMTLEFGKSGDQEVRGSITIPDHGTYTLVAMNADEKMIALSSEGSGGGLAAVFEVSTKPLIWLLWLGMVVLSIGSLIATKRRFKPIAAE